jgi:AraC-like DNA-binding protein
MSKEEIHPKMYIYKRIVEAKLYIDQNYSDKIDLSQISNQAHFSKYHFLRLFKNAFGMSPHQYLTDLRISKSKILLKQRISPKEVCHRVGFESFPSFSALFKKRIGLSPKEYQIEIIAKEEQALASPFSFVPNCFVQSYGWNE